VSIEGDLLEDVRRLKEDVWYGRGKHDPSIVTRLSELEADMIEVKKGVANFRSFQLTAQKRLGFLNGAVWVAGGVWTIALLLLAWAMTLIIPAAKLIMDDYYHNHPAAKVSMVEPEQASYNIAK
jgi:hypothetical protein